jgi:hypothetical protein
MMHKPGDPGSPAVTDVTRRSSPAGIELGTLVPALMRRSRALAPRPTGVRLAFPA